MSTRSRFPRWFDSHAFVGVNGVGKTPSVKLAHKYKQEGKKLCGSCSVVGVGTSC